MYFFNWSLTGLLLFKASACLSSVPSPCNKDRVHCNSCCCMKLSHWVSDRLDAMWRTYILSAEQTYAIREPGKSMTRSFAPKSIQLLHLLFWCYLRHPHFVQSMRSSDKQYSTSRIRQGRQRKMTRTGTNLQSSCCKVRNLINVRMVSKLGNRAMCLLLQGRRMY